MMVPKEPFSRGEFVGGCTIERLLAVAGCGFVYRAHEPDGTLVALKVARPDANYLRFDIEAAVGTSLNNHPSIVRALRSGRHNGVPFIVFEYISFPTLSILRKQPGFAQFSESVIMHTAWELSGALAYAYVQTGIVAHRDVKPGNIFIDLPRIPGQGAVKLSDFGVAKKIDSELTGTLDFIGVAPYLAPEIMLHNHYSQHSDMFSLGVVLYIMATGDYPFPVSSTRDLSVVTRYVNEDIPDVRQRRPDLSAECAAVMMGCLRRNPSDRHPTMDALRAQVSGMNLPTEREYAPAPAYTPEPVATAEPDPVYIDDGEALFGHMTPSSDGANWGIILGFAGGVCLMLSAMVLLLVMVLFLDASDVVTVVAVLAVGGLLALAGVGLLVFTAIAKLGRSEEPQFRSLDEILGDVLSAAG